MYKRYTVTMEYRVLCSSPPFLLMGCNNRGAEPPEGTLSLLLFFILFCFIFFTSSPR